MAHSLPSETKVSRQELENIMSLFPDLTEDDLKAASPEESAAAVQERPPVSYWSDAWRRLKKNKIAIIAFITIVILILLAVFGPMVSPYTYDQNDDRSKNFPFHRHRFFLNCPGHRINLWGGLRVGRRGCR